MKTNILNLVSFGGTSLAIAILIVIIAAIGTAKGQTNLTTLDQPNLSGLFTPTAADRFFEEGRRNMEREAEILNHPERYSRGDILQFSNIDIKIVDETGAKIPISDFLEAAPPEELD